MRSVSAYALIPGSPTRGRRGLRLTRWFRGGYHPIRKETTMPRNAGDRYACEKCGAQLVYEKACPCPPEMPHVEICCGQQMKRLETGGLAA